MRLSAKAFLFLFSLSFAGAAYADPPHWAPAHGRRDHDRHWDHGRRDDHWRHDKHYTRHWVRHPYYVQRDVVVVEPAPVYVSPSLPVVNSAPYVQVRCTRNNTILGTVIGGAAGGLVGNQFGRGSGRTWATIGGALLGASVGNNIGAANETCATQALEYARPNTQVVWQDAGNAYSIYPTNTYQQNGMYCREYQSRVMVGGQVQEGYGTACRQPDGAWMVMN